MSQVLTERDHVLMARGASPGTIVGAAVGSVAALMLVLICSLPFILKGRRKRRLRKRQQNGSRSEMAMNGSRPVSQAFSTPGNRLSQGRFPSTVGTLTDRDSQIKECGPDGIVYHRGAAPSLAAKRMSMPSCSPAPSIIMGQSSTDLAGALAAVSRRDSPAPGQAPFKPPPDPVTGPSETFGTMNMTAEPEPLSRSPTDGMHAPHSPSLGGAFRKIHNKVFHRGTERSSGSDSRGAGNRSLDEGDNELAQGLPAPYLVDEKTPQGGLAAEYYSGAAAEYYSGAPMSPEEEQQFPAPSEGSHPHLMHFIAIPGANSARGTVSRAQDSGSPYHLGSPFNPPAAPLSPTSPFVKEEESSSDDGSKNSYEAKGDSLSPPPRGLPFEAGPKKFEPPPSPSHPAPGTVNPMDMMKPSTAEEQAAWIDTEIWKLENSPSPQIDNSSPPQSEPSPPPLTESSPPIQAQSPPQSRPEPYPPPEIPHFQAVVRHPTQNDITANGPAMSRPEGQTITDISDTSSPGLDQYAYGPSPPSNHTTPESRLTDPGSQYTGSPSPRSTSSNRPASVYSGTDYLEAAPGEQSEGYTAGDVSPKPTSFACEICGSRFDQVHKLNHHRRYHERPHQCPQCEKRFGTKTHLDRHINDKHNKTRKYHCTVPGCAYSKSGGGKSFPRKDNWRRHMQNKHSVQNPPEPVEEDVVMGEA